MLLSVAALFLGHALAACPDTAECREKPYRPVLLQVSPVSTKTRDVLSRTPKAQAADYDDNVRKLNLTGHGHGHVPLDGVRLAVFCILKQKFMHAYRFDKPPNEPQIRNKSCAVVSSSGALKMHQHGSDIDAHDVVFRFNRAPVKGFEVFVGHRTSYRLGWDFPAHCKNCWDINKSKDMGARPVSNSNLTWAMKNDVWRPANISVVKRGITEDLTSGFGGMLQVLSNCGPVDAYEIVPSAAAKKSNYSYYGKWQASPGKALTNSWHGLMAAEHKLWSMVSLTPESTIKDTGKSSYLPFEAVNCERETSLTMALRNDKHISDVLDFIEQMEDVLYNN